MPAPDLFGGRFSSLDTPAYPCNSDINLDTEQDSPPKKGERPEPRNCGRWYMVWKCVPCGDRTAIPITCNDRVRCRRCARTRARRLLRKYQPFLESLRWPSFITLTLKHKTGESIKMMRKRLLDGFGKLKRRKAFKAVKQGLASIEVTRGRDERWHVHMHILADCKWLDQKALSADWKKITLDSHIVHVKRVYGGMAKAAKELMKYVTKQVGEKVGKRMADELRGLKMFTWFGKPPYAEDGEKWGDKVRCAGCGSNNLESCETIYSVRDMQNSPVWRDFHIAEPRGAPQ